MHIGTYESNLFAVGIVVLVVKDLRSLDFLSKFVAVLFLLHTTGYTNPTKLLQGYFGVALCTWVFRYISI
jgi:hypothetical protein